MPERMKAGSGRDQSRYTLSRPQKRLEKDQRTRKVTPVSNRGVTRFKLDALIAVLLDNLRKRNTNTCVVLRISSHHCVSQPSNEIASSATHLVNHGKLVGNSHNSRVGLMAVSAGSLAAIPAYSRGSTLSTGARAVSPSRSASCRRSPSRPVRRS